MKKISYQELSAVLRYEGGKLISIANRGRCLTGAVVGFPVTDGYLAFNYRRSRLQCHRVIWLLVYGSWPEGILDHKNGNRTDNRIENLRIATHAQNIANAKVLRTNTSGYKGVNKRRSGKWQAVITVNQKKTSLGTFADIEDAAAAYAKAARSAFGDFANVDRRT